MKKLVYLFEQKQADFCDFFGCDKNERSSLEKEGVIYRVEERDDLEKIALKFNCPPSVIVADNFLDSQVSAGDLLFVVNKTKPLYRIRPRDDLSFLTEISGHSISELMSINKVNFFHPWQLISLG